MADEESEPMDIEQFIEVNCSNFLDFTNVEEDEETEKAVENEPQPSTSQGRARDAVEAVPSHNSLTFILPDSFDLNESVKEHLQNADPNDSVVFAEELAEFGPAKEPSDDEDDEVMVAKRKRELTDQYLAGNLSFQDFVREMNPDSDPEDEDENEDDEDEDGDEEWKPSKKSKVGKQQPTERQSRSKTPEEPQVEDQQIQFETELEETSRQQLGKKRKRVGVAKTRRKRLDPALQGLMGEANLRYVRGDKESAIRMCMEVIRQDPTAPEPFQTLSTLYEEMEEHEKSLQFALIAAHLAPQDAEEWSRLADMSMEQGDLNQAVDCYKKAIEADVENGRYHMARCNLLEQLGQNGAALRGYKRFLGVLKEEQGAEFLYISKEISRLLHERGATAEAKLCLEKAFEKHPESVDSADINLMLELLILLQQFEEALEVVCRWCNAQFSSDKSQSELADLSAEQQLEAFTAVVLPEGSPYEIVSKVVVILLQLKAHHLVKDMSDSVLRCQAEEYGDLMLDIAEAYMAQSLFRESLPFLEKLVKCEEYAKAAVWLRYGESLFETGRLEESEQAFQTVVRLAPQHHDARRTLSVILNRLGRPEEALHTLAQDEEAELLNPTLLYERCQLLASENRTEEFITKAKLLLSRHFVNIRNREELHAIASAKKLTSKNKALSEVRAFRREPLREEEGPNFDKETVISVEDEFDLFRKLCSKLFDLGRYGDLQRVTFSAMGSSHFNKKPELNKECEFLCLLSSILNGDSYHAYNLVRELVTKQMKNNRIWNLLNLVIMHADDVRHNRFLMRLMSRNPDNLALGILNGHNCLVAGTYKYSLGEYMSAFKQDKNNPMVALMLGLTFTHMACQKFSAKKHSLVVQACAFLNTYLHLRGECQEAYYNLGRAMHQLGLLPAALHYYKKALALGASTEDEVHPGMYDLCRETAYNISLIYQGSGSNALARMYIEKYIVV